MVNGFSAFVSMGKDQNPELQWGGGVSYSGDCVGGMRHLRHSPKQCGDGTEVTREQGAVAPVVSARGSRRGGSLPALWPPSGKRCSLSYTSVTPENELVFKNPETN